MGTDVERGTLQTVGPEIVAAEDLDIEIDATLMEQFWAAAGATEADLMVRVVRVPPAGFVFHEYKAMTVGSSSNGPVFVEMPAGHVRRPVQEGDQLKIRVRYGQP